MWPAKDKEMIKPRDKEKMKYSFFLLSILVSELFQYQRLNTIPDAWHRMDQSPTRSLMVDLFA